MSPVPWCLGGNLGCCLHNMYCANRALCHDGRGVVSFNAWYICSACRQERDRREHHNGTRGGGQVRRDGVRLSNTTQTARYINHVPSSASLWKCSPTLAQNLASGFPVATDRGLFHWLPSSPWPEPRVPMNWTRRSPCFGMVNEFSFCSFDTCITTCITTGSPPKAVSYTHLTLPTNREV